ncbi:hypothetical protein G6F70_006435 [Rhizopus microsporus]|nr:hypothetical protein G6F71_003464 [Rhizopus microsporus]KAG1197674.1 hypothetical protein G6F70_006435 [Rhizopus microsporus]KAG1209382.1 hypothetical protein G6F69_006398 [Rhizopus microsporus]KAG1230910.1 hypothetical protein G6F67_006144 [Rhizopus microsporus]KAG1263194.1 hypothetical protein G6F68_005321 [Rhizopus microsporus]
MHHQYRASIYNRTSLLIEKARGPKWKRELVSDHKFDFIDIDEFYNTSCIADIWTACTLLIYNKWSLSTQPKIPFYITWEIRKARAVMATEDVSLAVTNAMAFRTYSLKSYTYFCLLQKIKSSTKWSDVVIFYVFYTLKGWKKIIVAQGPRQIIAGFTVYALLRSAWTKQGHFQFSVNPDDYGSDWQQRAAFISMSFTCILWIISILNIGLAVILYFPILCHIQGNLKEYCCHKIDKRINEILAKQRKRRLKETEKKKAQSVKKPRKDISNDGIKPTLPVVKDADLYTSVNMIDYYVYPQVNQIQAYESHYATPLVTPIEPVQSIQRKKTAHAYNNIRYIHHEYNQYAVYQKPNVAGEEKPMPYF